MMQDMNETDNKQKKGGGMFSKIKAVGRRAATVAAGTVLVLSQCLGSFGAAFAPSTAYADTSTKTASLVMLIQLIKISQRIDGTATLPAIKDIVFLIIYATIFIWLLKNSLKICAGAYDLFNESIC